MIILILLNIFFIIYVYVKYYKFPKNIEDKTKEIEAEDSIVIGYINDLNFNNNYDLILAEIIDLNVKGYIKINYGKESLEKYDYTVSLNIDMASTKLNRYELLALNFLFSNKMKITKAELEEKINNIYELYNIQFKELEEVLNEKITKENIIDKKKEKVLTKTTKWTIKISILLVLGISILNAIGALYFSRIYVLIYAFEKIVLAVMLLKANPYTEKGKILKYNLEKYKLGLEEKEFFTENETMEQAVVNKEFANSIALHINTQAKNTFMDNKILQNSHEVLKKTITNTILILFALVVLMLLVTIIMVTLSKGALAWLCIFIAIGGACIADVTLYKKK
jgi:membrane protein